jgi:hypothetical protein
LFLGRLIEKIARKIFLVIYDDDFLKKHHCCSIMPGRLKMLNRIIIIKLILEISQIWSKNLKIIRPFSKAVLDSSYISIKK